MKIHTGYQIFHEGCQGIDETTVTFLYLPHHRTEGAHLLNGIPYILADEFVINTADFITRASEERDTFGTWDTVQHI